MEEIKIVVMKIYELEFGDQSHTLPVFRNFSLPYFYKDQKKRSSFLAASIIGKISIESLMDEFEPLVMCKQVVQHRDE